MKKDRNCTGATPYPIYPNYGPMPMNPAMAGPIGYGMPVATPMQTPMTMSSGSSYTTTDNEEFNRLKEQIQNLDRRVSRLESMVNNKTTSFGSQYTDANYHIM